MTILPQKILMSGLLLLCALGFVGVAHAEVLLPVNVNGQFGYVNTSGRMVIAPQFDSALEFAEGLAVVGKKSGRDLRFGFIDEKGVVRIPIQFQNVRSFAEGLAVVVFRDRHGFIDKTGKIVIKTDFVWAYDFRGGAAKVRLVTTSGVVSDGYIDRSGRVIWSP